MATVPGPQPDRPFPPPGAPEEPPRERDDDERVASPPGEDTDPSWLPEPYSPDREFAEPELPAAVP